MFYADLHIHSKFSRATSRDADLEHMAIWARKKGVSVLGTGDFTHPQWFAEINEKLVPAEPGLFRLRDDLQREVDGQVAGACQGPTRFMLEVEISTIYKKGDRTRKVHHLIYSPDLEKAERLIQKLSKIGNLKSDGRPILGLDSRDLLEITLECGEGCYLIPAHIWTPWFAALGSKSGFDSIEDCYGDLSSNIFAVETGLSSDPPMNWRLSSLDRYQLVSNSDAHSPPKIGREACAFETEINYFAMRQALETGEGYAGTVEFFPEEGKYHMDGHRKCRVRLSPEDTREADGRCPACGKNLTVGVMNRVDSLADRPVDFRPDQSTQFRSLVPLPEVIAEIRGVGEKSKKVQHAYEDLIARVGSELSILDEVPIEDIRRAGAPLVAEAVHRMREGQVIREAGYDGEYGTIRLFEEGELGRREFVSVLFELREPNAEKETDAGPAKTAATKQIEDTLDRDLSMKGAVTSQDTLPHPVTNDSPGLECSPRKLLPEGEGTNDVLCHLDRQQRMAAEVVHGPLLIIAGPGTGKTRTLTHRIAHLIARHGVSPRQCLTVTFSRRAAREMSERLEQLLPGIGDTVPVMTFHALGLLILREHAALVNLVPTFRIATEAERMRLLVDGLKLSEQKARRALSEISAAKRRGQSDDSRPDSGRVGDLYHNSMRDRGWIDFDDLIRLSSRVLESNPEVAAVYRSQWPWVSIDEFQDIDPCQYRLIRDLVPPEGNICAIGDPDQSIYGFRGGSPEFFRRFTDDFPHTRTIQLTTNYRSSRTIVDAAQQVILPSTLVAGRALRSLSQGSRRIQIRACPSDRAEAEFVVHTIEQLIGGASFFSMDSDRVESDAEASLAFSDFAVLYRSEQQSKVLTEAFSRSGMPYQHKSHRRLADEPAVEALVDFIHGSVRTAHDKAADEAVDGDLLKRAVDAVWDQHPGIAEYHDELVRVRQRCGDDWTRFLTELGIGVEVDLWDSRADRVSLLTLHAAKGLEFPVVFLVGCEGGVLPLRWGRPTEKEDDEERRLFFVGMTRARDRLILSHSKKRRWRGKLQEMAPSPFLLEIKDELLNREKHAVHRKGKRRDDHQLQLF